MPLGPLSPFLVRIWEERLSCKASFERGPTRPNADYDGGQRAGSPYELY